MAPTRFRNSPSQNPALTFPQDDVTDYKGKVIFKARTEDYLDLVEAGLIFYNHHLKLLKLQLLDLLLDRLIQVCKELLMHKLVKDKLKL